MSTTRVCPHCGGHFDVANWICPHCGAEFPRPRPARPGWLDRVAPAHGQLTKAVIGVTTAVFVLEIVLAGSTDPTVGLLAQMGGLVKERVAAGEVWRLVTPMLLHAGILHILFNMFALFQVGPLVEETFGRPQFLVLYLLSGVCGEAASYLLSPAYGVGIGASGAICGFLGVLAVWGFRRGGTVGALVRRTMIRWALLILVFGLIVKGIDNAAHAGGFVGGGALAFLISPKGFRPETFRRRRLWNVAAVGVLLVFAASAAAAVVSWRAERLAEERVPEIRAVDLLLRQAVGDVERTAELPAPPDLVPEPSLRSHLAGLRQTAERLRDASDLGGGAARAVDRMRQAVDLRIRQLEARAESHDVPEGDALTAATEAWNAWSAWLEAEGFHRGR
jgi:rhomboid protease GluP